MTNISDDHGIYANENDPQIADWLAQLPLRIDRVDDRSIEDVQGWELDGYTQCHFFAGIGGWPYALQLAGWPNDLEVWTGSPPCQPFSNAGKRKGNSDERHLWPEFYRLIDECRPAIVFGEQVASKAARKWLAGVRDDMEALGYAVGAADLCAASVGAPHIRQRLFWVAYGLGQGSQERIGERLFQREERRTPEGQTVELRCDVGGARRGRSESRRSNGDGVGLEHAESDGRKQGRAEPVGRIAAVRRGEAGFWSEADYLYCSDGKYRPVEPGTFPLANGIPGRVAQLRRLGNAIVPQVASEFIRASWEAILEIRRLADD